MKNTTILLMKFITAIIAFAIGLDLFFDATILEILSFSFFITLISYIIGDKMILPRLGMSNATIADFLLTYMSVWVFGSVLLNNILQIAWGSLLSASIITIGEIFVHRSLADTVTNERQYRNYSPKLAYGTEFAEENDVHDLNKKEE